MRLDDVAAGLSGVRKYTKQAVSRWEHGLSEPPSAVLFELTRMFGVDLSIFFT